MRIATQTESALICKEYSSPFIMSRIPVFPAPQRTPSPNGQALEYTVQSVVQTDHHRCSLLATVKRDIGRPVVCVVCLAISPRCLPPVSSGLRGSEILTKPLLYQRQLDLSCRHVNTDSTIDVSTKCQLSSLIRFLRAEEISN
ncbi:hypothetical protein TNCV_1929551 [Trichonephila clavipes]|nr:hypothetical protein TNCV_1929551 [Trichonephila clavipes]